MMDWLFSGIRLAAFISMSGAFFALGIAGICKWLNWAPVNLTVNIHHYQDREPRPSPGAADE